MLNQKHCEITDFAWSAVAAQAAPSAADGRLGRREAWGETPRMLLGSARRNAMLQIVATHYKATATDNEHSPLRCCHHNLSSRRIQTPRSNACRIKCRACETRAHPQKRSARLLKNSPSAWKICMIGRQ